jgi:phosphoglycolate phosphatase-like HAD superfamily hydrolase
MDRLAIFDVDGTICDTQEVEGYCYAEAIGHIIGKSLSTLDWSAYPEPTSTAIVRDLLAGDPEAERKEEEIKHEFVRLLERERPKYPGDFAPIPGAIEFITRIKAENICDVAIATGCFDSSARFKLECCGIILDEFPYATSSDTSRRREIIPLAASRAGFDMNSVIYFGDALWDVHVSGILGVPMIGIGRRYMQLRSQGVRYAFCDYTDGDKIVSALSITLRSCGSGACAPERRYP